MDDDLFFFLFGVFAGIIMLGGILAICGVFDNPADRLNLDKGKLFQYHITKYYPEYENCSFKYLDYDEIDCKNGISGVVVYCGEKVTNKDGVTVLYSSQNPTITFCLDDVDEKQVFNELLEDYKK